MLDFRLDLIMLRRVAVHRVLVDGKVVKMCAVGIEDNGRVAYYEPLSGETPFTEWIGGTIVLGRDGQGRLVVEKISDS